MKLNHASDLKAKPGQTVKLSIKGKDPDGDKLSYKWWQYREPSSYKGEVKIQAAKKPQASFELPAEAKPGRTVHIICEVTDDSDPPLTRYARVIVECE